MNSAIKIYDKAILEYMFSTGTFYPYEHLSEYEKTMYLMKIWRLEKPILKGVFNGKEIVDIVVPITEKMVLNPYNGVPLTIKTDIAYKKNSEIYFVFNPCEASSKDGLSSELPRKLINIIYFSSEYNDCRVYLKKNSIKATAEKLDVFHKRKYRLCNAIQIFNSQFVLEELNKKSDKILAVEGKYLSENDKKCFLKEKNTTGVIVVKDFTKLSIAEKSLIKLMCYLDIDSRYELYCQLSEHLKKLFLQCYWNSVNLIVPCKMAENEELRAVYQIDMYNRHPHPFRSDYIVARASDFNDGKNMNTVAQEKYIKIPVQIRINVDNEILNSMKKNKENQYNCVVGLKRRLIGIAF